jgi:hypothetical protein
VYRDGSNTFLDEDVAEIMWHGNLPVGDERRAASIMAFAIGDRWRIPS